VKLDFPDMDDDPNLKEAVEELKRRGQEKLKQESLKRLRSDENPEIINKRLKT
jgi:hypothetical protein